MGRKGNLRVQRAVHRDALDVHPDVGLVIGPLAPAVVDHPIDIPPRACFLNTGRGH
jgi:hypothetical protein